MTLARDLAIRERRKGESHPDLAVTLNDLGVLFKRQHQSDRALPLYRRSAAIFRAALGETHPRTITSLANLRVAERDAVA